MIEKKTRGVFITILFGLILVALPDRALAHCDGMDGPVVQAARRALDTANVNLVLIWVPAQSEQAVRSAFLQTLAVRKLSPEARALADQYFFETLVRVHRAGEGEPYTGLKPAGRDLGPAIPAADRALEQASIAALEKLLTETARDGLQQRFEKVAARKNYPANDTAAGRAFVQAYVEFIQYVERVYEAAKRTGTEHEAAPAKH